MTGELKSPKKPGACCPDCGSLELQCRDCGSVFTMKAASKPRSYPQLKRYFAVIRAAMHHWPEKHEFQPRNVDHLRYWFEVQAGHFHVSKTIKCSETDPVKLVALLRAVLSDGDDSDKVFVEVEDSYVYVKRAVSISYEALQHLATCALFTDVDAIIEKEVGIPANKLLQQTEMAA